MNAIIRSQGPLERRLMQAPACFRVTLCLHVAHYWRVPSQDRARRSDISAAIARSRGRDRSPAETEIKRHDGRQRARVWTGL